MPYRRLPNTDAARLKALHTAYDIGRKYPPFKLAFSQSGFQKVQSFLFTFDKSMNETKKAYENQVAKNKDYLKTVKKAKLYVSHFIQVVNMAILRGELPVSERTYFNLGEDEKKTPPLNSEAELIEWGEKIIKGEASRRTQGRSPITNPTIAVVKVRYEQFLDAFKFQKTLQKNHHRLQEQLATLRPTADDIILQIWNEVEAHFDELEDDERRNKCMEYGVNYIYRKNEIQKLKSINNLNLNDSV